MSVLTYRKAPGLIDGVMAKLGRPCLVVIIRLVLFSYVNLKNTYK